MFFSDIPFAQMLYDAQKENLMVTTNTNNFCIPNETDVSFEEAYCENVATLNQPSSSSKSDAKKDKGIIFQKNFLSILISIK